MNTHFHPQIILGSALKCCFLSGQTLERLHEGPGETFVVSPVRQVSMLRKEVTMSRVLGQSKIILIKSVFSSQPDLPTLLKVGTDFNSFFRSPSVLLPLFHPMLLKLTYCSPKVPPFHPNYWQSWFKKHNSLVIFIQKLVDKLLLFFFFFLLFRHLIPYNKCYVLAIYYSIWKENKII